MKENSIWIVTNDMKGHFFHSWKLVIHYEVLIVIGVNDKMLFSANEMRNQHEPAIVIALIFAPFIQRSHER